MAFDITPNAEVQLKKTNKEPNIIVEIDGITEIFTAIKLFKTPRFCEDDLVFCEDNLIACFGIPDPNHRAWVALEGTDQTISQQIEIDKGGRLSVQKVKIRIIDKDEYLTRLFETGETIPDILGARAKVYYGFKNTVHPEDSILLASGPIEEFTYGAGYVQFRVANPETIKRQDYLTKVTTKLSADINDSTLSIPVQDQQVLQAPVDFLETYVRIGDELIQYTNASANVISASARGQLNTPANPHDEDDEVESFYVLTGRPIPLALKIMLSAGPEYWVEDIEIKNFVEITSQNVDEQSILLKSELVPLRTNVTAGDFITVEGAANGANNFTLREIQRVENIKIGTLIVVDGAPLVIEKDSSATCKFKSKYNVLPEGHQAGLQMTPEEVDIPEFEEVESTFFSNFHEHVYYLSDTVKANDFINSQIMFTAGLYSIPRKGKVSVNITTPPLYKDGTIRVSERNIIGPDKLKINRSTNKYFYNGVVYKYETDSLETDKFLRGVITQNEDSQNRIKIGNRPLTIEAQGFRDNQDTDRIIDLQTNRLLDRYKYGARYMEIPLLFEDGFRVEVGDTSLFELEGVKVSDENIGSRRTKVGIWEAINKKQNLITAKTTITYLDTSYSANGRYCSIGPSSEIVEQVSPNRIRIRDSFGTATRIGKIEQYKWLEYRFEDVQIRTLDYSITETVRFVGFDPTDPYVMVLDPNLTVSPVDGWIVDMPYYPDTDDPKDQEIWKAAHGFWNPQVIVTMGISDTQFEVDPLDIGKFFTPGCFVRVHNFDYSMDSGASEDIEVVEVDTINNRITVSQGLTYTPAVGDEVDLIGFSADKGLPYRYI